MLRRFYRMVVLLCLVCALAAPALAELKPIELPAPRMSGGKPLLDALAERRTVRTFADKPFTAQQLSNLLWAAFGINRASMVPIKPEVPVEKRPPATPGRTAPSGVNRQDVQILVVLPEGVYLWDFKKNVLNPVVEGDQRSKIGGGGVLKAAVTLVYMTPINDKFAQVDAGFIGQNVYLWATSEGLNAWFYSLHLPESAPALKVDKEHDIFYGQSIGFPEK